MTRVLIAGISTRAVAESAARAGFEVVSFDAFADLDQHPAVVAHPLTRGFGPYAAVRAAGRFACQAVAYLSNFENHPDAVAAFADARALWGNPPSVLRRVRNPHLLAEALRAHGLPAPRLDGGPDADWLIKPLASGGGSGIRRWPSPRRIPSGCYLQEYVDGVSASVVFVADGRKAQVLGLSRQLVGLPSFGAAAFQYCGNIRDPELCSTAVVATVEQVVAVVTEHFGLVGVNGIDFVLRDGVPYVTEVNPRWSSSMELMERSLGISVFAAHAAACVERRLTALGTRMDTEVTGKAIVYARHVVTIGDTHTWLDDPCLRDVPRPGSRIAAGRPICTVFAAGVDHLGCLAALERHAARIYAYLVPATTGAAIA